MNFLSEVSGLPDHRFELPAFPVEFPEWTELMMTARAELSALGDTMIEMIWDAYLDCCDEKTES
ncbi:hypothetical protein OB919_05210 [Halobacteria archaeon AArc-curdl1]|uniref:Uncharacterized protein n=1 Tax=Natronosalvus hydrolyticus TaxID=2979988 RepID=A0AAP2Z620_9EURY|nr:hypothetical protein [Halobacteria archaeon AArc-curdl1]